ncbi:hypothetical protein CF66_2102 [Candidatus Photodesmus katoptron]|uniref:Transcriptional regulatory protein n=1 Tax=Candidatus Photodesmus katoptron Akat1 TaxID=1236703 RepID=S3DHE4_9GAMM|nr:transglycosylase SLT domain-containing protein [Candidatus Photodesmus katoptron]EPE37842.1 transcriptional regulatory protein [Candidatus Photodesmus katoptron Akat1]KEY90439.1 hypothetical protein CF66_2102 [Candidatus Photodesmus katoptron]
MKLKCLYVVICTILFSGCVSSPPKQKNDICAIFQEKPNWYAAAVKMKKKFRVPIHIAMAFMAQESNYKHNARPPKKYILGFIPWGRLSTAYGYAQAKDSTWKDFQNEINSSASRTNFDNSIMFIGWYINETQKQLGISKWDSYNQYIAYHEGRRGYKQKRYQSNLFLKNIAKKVEEQARDYGWQLKKCQKKIDTNRYWSFW